MGDRWPACPEGLDAIFFSKQEEAQEKDIVKAHDLQQQAADDKQGRAKRSEWGQQPAGKGSWSQVQFWLGWDGPVGEDEGRQVPEWLVMFLILSWTLANRAWLLLD